MKRTTRYFVLSPMSKAENRGLIAVIGDEDTVTGFLLAGTGEVDAKQARNFLVVTPHTTIGALEVGARGGTRAAFLRSAAVPLTPATCLCCRSFSGKPWRVRTLPLCSSTRYVIDAARCPWRRRAAAAPRCSPFPRPSLRPTRSAGCSTTTRPFSPPFSRYAGAPTRSRNRTAALTNCTQIPSKESPYDPSKDSVMARVKLLFGSGN